MMLILMVSCGRSAAPLKTVAVQIGGQIFHLEVAATPKAHFQGLSDRPQLPPNGGMLFVFPEAAPRTFVMRRCLIPLDIVFLSPAQRIIAMHHMRLEPPGTPEDQLAYYTSQWPAQYALELPAGSIDKLGLREGQKIDLPLDELKPS